MNLPANLHERPELLSSLEFWTEAWQAAIDKSHVSRRRRDIDIYAFWGRMADVFERLSRQDRSKPRMDRAFGLLEMEKFTFKDRKVLDIGCGIGDFCLAFAAKGAKVTALEPSEPLLAKLLQRKAEKNETNIETLNKEWKQANLDGDIISGSFDLAFVSLNPGLRDPEALEKMISSSREFCLLCDIAAGGSSSPSRAELWKLIFSEEMPPTCYNIIYPLGYLYSRGYHPSLVTWAESWSLTQPLEEAVSGALDFFSLYVEPGRSLRRVIENYFEKKAFNGLYSEEYSVHMGMIMWKVKKG